MGFLRRRSFFDLPIDQGRLTSLLSVAAAAHSGQNDRIGHPVLLHVIRVMERAALQVQPDSVNSVVAVALLHDAWEDKRVAAVGSSGATHPFRIEVPGTDLHAWLTETEFTAIQAIAREADEAYPQYILRVAGSPLATMVKIADLQDNLDARRHRHLDRKDSRRLEAKYVPALGFLKRALAEHRSYALYHEASAMWAEGK